MDGVSQPKSPNDPKANLDKPLSGVNLERVVLSPYSKALTPCGAVRYGESRGTPLLHHHRSAAWLITIQEKGQRHHQDRSKTKHVINVHIGQGLGLRL